MQLVIRATNVPVSDPIRAHVATRVLSAAKRFGRRLARVTVVLEDENGPRGGIDKACRIEAGLSGAGAPVVITERSDDLYGAIDRATSRLKRTLARRAEERTSRVRKARRGQSP